MARRGRARRTWRQDPAGRRAAVLEAAARAFATNGYRRARIEDVAREAGVAEGTVYHLFDSKQGLLTAVGADYGAGLVRAAFGEGKLEVRPGPDVEAMVGRIFRHVAESGGPLAAFLLTGDPEAGGPAQAACTAAGNSPNAATSRAAGKRTHMRSRVSDGVSSGSCDPTTPRSVHAMPQWPSTVG